jgi:ADP-ribose pyrophosphatase YjhB (NUDIX family)
LEETGLEVGDIKFLTATNDVFEGEGKHYVTVFVTCVIVGEEKVARVSCALSPIFFWIYVKMLEEG